MHTVASSKWFKILRDDAGADESIDPGSDEVIVIVRDDDGRIVLVEEPSVAFGTNVFLFPTGSIAPDEEVLEAAQRELREETGFGARKLTRIGALRPWSRYLKVTSHFVLAHELYSAPLEADEKHTIVVHWRTSDQLGELIASGELSDARVVAGLALLRMADGAA